MDAIPFPKIVVPGNHDVPLHNIFERLFRKLDRFRRFISEDLEPFYVDDEIAVAGVNTARALTGKNGRINRQQLAKLRARFATLPPAHIKIVVTHHPFDLPPGVEGDRVVFRARPAMKILAQIPVDMLLAGHFHVAGTNRTTTRYKIDNYSALIVASGTTTSTRGRGQPNSLNVIQIERRASKSPSTAGERSAVRSIFSQRKSLSGPRMAGPRHDMQPFPQTDSVFTEPV